MLEIEQDILFLSQPAQLKSLTQQHIDNHQFELKLTSFRQHVLLECDSSSIDDTIIQILSALAIQCYLNEYVFYVSTQEEKAVDEVENKICDQRSDNLLFELLIYACYRPLYKLDTVESSKDILLQQHNSYITDLVDVQISEPLLELQYKKNIPQLSNLDNSISRKVGQHYETNPYPRWSSLSKTSSTTIQELLITKLDTVYTQTVHPLEPQQILIAGCGTGKSIVENARRFPKSNIIALDLSRNSLAYAKRMQDKYDISNVEMYQADFIQLPSDWKQFDYIESVGVLSHLENPTNGIQLLSKLLKPAGTMRLSLYNKNTRGFINRVREFLHKNYTSELQGLRTARRHILNNLDNTDFTKVASLHDFYSLSECRDLLFHVYEQEVDADYIQQVIEELNLTLLGFEISDSDLQYVFWVYKHE